MAVPWQNPLLDSPCDEVRTDSAAAPNKKYRKLIDRAARGPRDVKGMPFVVYEVRELAGLRIEPSEAAR